MAAHFSCETLDLGIQARSCDLYVLTELGARSMPLQCPKLASGSCFPCSSGWGTLLPGNLARQAIGTTKPRALMPAGIVASDQLDDGFSKEEPAEPMYEDWLFRCTARTWVLVGSKYIHLSSWNVSRSSRPPLNQQRVDEFSNPLAQQPFCQTKNVTSDITSYFSKKYMGVISKFAASALTVII